MHGGGGAQIEGAKLAIVEQQGQLLALGLLVAAFDHPAGDDEAGHGLAAELQFQARALELIEHGAERLRAADLEGELGQLVAEGVHGVVAHAGDLRAALFLDHERFQNVVHLGGVEIEPRGFARPEPPGALEEPHAMLVQHHLFDWQIRGEGHGGSQDRQERNASHNLL